MEPTAAAAVAFKFGTATPFNRIAPIIGTSTNDGRAPIATGPTSAIQTLSEVAEQSTVPRALFPGLQKSGTKPQPFAIAGKCDNQDITALVKDSGRKNAKHFTEGNVAAHGVTRDVPIQQKEVR